MKNLFLVGLPQQNKTIEVVLPLPSSCDWQTKHDAEEAIKTLSEEQQNTLRFFVVASNYELVSGEEVDTARDDVCFMLI